MTERGKTELPRLSRELIESRHLTSDRVVLPEPALLELPEKAIQFGTGAFLRGFVDYFLDEANRRGDCAGRVVAVASTATPRDTLLEEQNGLYTLVVEGSGNDGPRRECRVIASVSRALSAQRSWHDVLAVARNPQIQLVFSNTTEVGIALDAADRFDASPPASYPAKLTRFLAERGETFDYAPDAGVVIVPCELIEKNGDRLRELVLTLADRWQLERRFSDWIERAVPFCNTLVDRIVPGRPNDDSRREIEHQLGYRDELMIAAEPYRLFAIEAGKRVRAHLAFARADDGITLTDDVTPFRERKVRILNGGHTVLAPLALLVGCQTVLEALRHKLLGTYLRRILYEEIVPSLTAPNGEAFAHDVLARFGNPYLRHALADITLQQTAKMRVRVIPSIVRCTERTGAVPALLAFGFAAYLFALRVSALSETSSRLPLKVDDEGERVRALWRGAADTSEAAIADIVRRVCADTALWQTDLARVGDFVARVTTDVGWIMHLGITGALTSALERQHASQPIALTSSPRSVL